MGVDVHHYYELMTSLEEDGTLEIANKEGEKVLESINEHTVREALHFKEGHKDFSRHLTKVDKDKVFL